MPRSVLAERLGDRYIKVTFDYEGRWVKACNKIPTHKFFGIEKPGGPYWRFRLDIDTCHQLRAAFGDELKVGKELGEWFSRENGVLEKLRTLARATTAELEYLPELAPDLYKFVSNRPYQLADIKFMAENPYPVNTNQPGTGKTVELIGSVFEGQNWDGPHLICAPVSSLEVVWEYELLERQDLPVIVAPMGRRGRIRAVDEALEMWKEGYAFWFVCNPAMITYRRKKAARNEDEPEIEDLEVMYPPLFEIEWNTFTVDEFHKCGMNNSTTLTARAMRDIKRGKSFGISGTPMQGKPIKWFSILQFIHPSEFTSKWEFADKWLEVTEVEYGRGQSSKKIGRVRPEKEEAFFKMLDRYVLRRTKAEIAPQLPPKQFVDIWVPWPEPKVEQERQYKQFEKLAAIKIDEEELSATSILAEFTRLKQFAGAECRVEKHWDAAEEREVMMLFPVNGKSVKMEQVERILNELGIDPDEENKGGDAQLVIASQFSRMVDMIHKYLHDKGYPVAKITGAVSRRQRSELTRSFQDENDPLRILCLTTTAGGVSITLDKADTMIVLDETWVPDDTEQLVDRIHRVSRIHQVTVYFIRTEGTIERYIQGVNIDKQDVNDMILDVRRQIA